jgi:hypothetical protein
VKVPSKTAFEKHLFFAAHVFATLPENGSQNSPNPDKIQTKSRAFSGIFSKRRPTGPQTPQNDQK